MRSESADLVLEAGESIARFSAIGAQCLAWRMGGDEILWPGDPEIWPQVSPVLFPVCGWSRDGRIRLGGKTYDMPVHGFAAAARFGVERRGASEILFRLTADEWTRTHYPFDFALEIVYRLAGDALVAEIGITNEGAAVMPYACGVHPGFVWRPSEGPHTFHLGADVSPEVPVIAPGGLFSSQVKRIPLRSGSLELTRDLFAQEALCFLDIASRSFALEGPRGRLEVDAPNFPHLVLWSRGGGDFLAIESWTGTGDLVDFDGDFHERPSMVHLEPGERRAHRVCWRWRPAASGRLAAAADSA